MRERCKLLALLLVLSVLVAGIVVLPTQVCAATNDLTIAVDDNDATFAYGGAVKATVSITENKGFLGVNFDILWDTEVLEFVGFEALSDFETVEANHQQKFNKLVVTVGDPMLGVMYPDKVDKITDTGKVLELTFKIKVDADAEPEIKLARASYVQPGGDASDAITLKSSTVHVINSTQKPSGDTNETCPTEKNEPVHTPGPAASCVAPQKCTVCGSILAEKLEHDLVTVPAKEVTCGESGWAEYEKCKYCNYTTCNETPATGEHNFDEWIIVTDATQAHAGEQMRTCKVCAFVETETIPMLGSAEQETSGQEATEQENTEQETVGQETPSVDDSGLPILPITIALVLVCAIVVAVIVLKKKNPEN